MSSTPTGTVRITVVPAPACHFCDDADRTLSELASTFAFETEHVPAASVEGQRLIATHRPALAPLVLVDGRYFSSGRLPGKKLVRWLSASATRREDAFAAGGQP